VIIVKKILIVDDSALMRRVIHDIISADSNYEVAKECRNGQEALDTLRTDKYDGVLLDVNMPVMDGLQLLQMLQKEKIAATVIMVSTLTKKDEEVTIKALEYGAVDFVTKPGSITEAKDDVFARRLLDTMNAVILRHSGFSSSATKTIDACRQRVASMPRITPPAGGGAFKGKKLIALASSTGGPKALHEVIPKLPKNMSCPMVMVQHMPAGFTKSMAERLNELSQVNVKEAEDNEPLSKGTVYIAPGGRHMRVVYNAADQTHRIKLSDEPAIGGLRPCADVMYDSLRDSGFDQITCVVLTGMGSDGTKGIVSLSEKKSIYTISQDKDSCVVYGMPRAIAETGIVNEVVPLTDVAKTIIKNVGVI